MASENLAAVVFKPGDLRLEKKAIPEPGPGEILIRMRSVGICGTDVHFWTHAAIGEFKVKHPLQLGHESSGVVQKLGPGVTHLKIGDRVTIEPSVPCCVCETCKSGKYNICPKISNLTDCGGNLARYHVHSAAFCYKIPDELSFDEGALVEPLAVGVHACRRANVSLGQKILVCGAGPIGLILLMVSKAAGAAKICVTDISPGRLAKAKELGADMTVLVGKNDTPHELAVKIEQTLGVMPDISFECSGVEMSIQAAIYATKPGGTYCQVGLGTPVIQFPIVNAAIREVNVISVFRYVNCFLPAIDLITSGKVDIKKLITHRFPLEQMMAAFEMAKSGADNSIKIILECNKE